MMNDYWGEIAFSGLSILVFIALRFFVSSFVSRHERKYNLNKTRAVYVHKFFNSIFFILLLVVYGFIWDVSFKGIFASFFAVAGVALFASWSILSNITASVILFFSFPIKIGSKIRIMDKDDFVEGTVFDITFFTIQIEQENGSIVSYPNNVAIQKAIVNLNPEHSEY